MAYTILATNAVSVSELKKNPMAAIAHAEGFPLAVLNRNEPAFYCVPPDIWENILDKLDDLELAKIAKKREKSARVRVNINDL